MNIAKAIAIDTQGNAYVTGYTNATDFPTTPGAYQPAIATYPTLPGYLPTYADAFVTKLNATGTGLIYSTYLGAGSTGELGEDSAVDKDGNAYVTGITTNGYVDIRLPQGTPFQMTPGAYRTTDTFGSGGGFIVNYIFITKFNATGTALSYSTLLGSAYSNPDSVGIAVDNTGSAYVSGLTTGQKVNNLPPGNKIEVFEIRH